MISDLNEGIKISGHLERSAQHWYFSTCDSAKSQTFWSTLRMLKAVDSALCVR